MTKTCGIIGEMRQWVGHSLPPEGWVVADGRLLDIHERPGLHAVIGRVFCGPTDSPAQFRLPDTRSFYDGTGTVTIICLDGESPWAK